MGNPLFDEVGKGEGGRRDSEKSVKICTPQIGIDEDNPDAQFRKADAKVGGDKTLPATSLATADRPDHLPIVGLSLPHPETSFLSPHPP